MRESSSTIAQSDRVPPGPRRGPQRWRYYVLQAALQGDDSKAGSIVRVPAANVEAPSLRPFANCLWTAAASQADFRNLIDRVTISRTKIQVQLAEAARVRSRREDANATVDAAVAISEA